MKKFFTTSLLILIIIYIGVNYEHLMRFAMINIVYHNEVLTHENNEYYRDYNWDFVHQTDNFYVNNSEDILNIFYTSLNGGWDELTFYCEENYDNCVNDLNYMIDYSALFSHVNNFVSPFNNYNRISVNINSLGRININFEKTFTDEMKKIVNEKIDSIINKYITNDMSDREKIRVIHDYIINHTVYDTAEAEYIQNGNKNSTFSVSSNAYGALINGVALCGGYSDAMALFLDRFGIKNYKIASDSHIWNAVYLDGKWLHLDLTWDDPVVKGENRLEHGFFLITTDELNKKATSQHNFDKNIYTNY